jgi:hypothetical protein
VGWVNLVNEAFGNAFELLLFKRYEMTFNNASMGKKAILIFATLGFMTGCAPMVSGAMNATMSEQGAAAKTAAYFGADQKDIVVSKFEKGALTSTWSTRYKGVFYNCMVYYGEVSCKQPGG